MQTDDDHRWAAPAAAGLFLVGTALFRYLAFEGSYNDQFEHLAGAQQMLAGEWPTVDFFDPGMPLTYAASAGAQLLSGRTLFAEAVLTSVMYGVAAACTFLGAHRLSRSLLVATAATLVSVAICPRAYAYPKLLVTAVAPLAIWVWVARRTWPRLGAMALVVVAAFLFRHDYAAYVGLAALTALVIAPADDRMGVAKRLALFSAIVAALIVPYAISLGGIEAFVASIRTFVEYGRRHSDRTALTFDTLGWTPEWQLFWGFHALPIAALAWVVVDWRRRQQSDAQLVIPLCAMAVAANLLLIRDPLSARLADAVVPAALTGSWLAGRARQVGARATRIVAMVAVVAFTAVAARAVWVVGAMAEQINRTGLPSRGIRGVPGLLAERTEELTDRYSPAQMPNGPIFQLIPFFEYLDRCTTERHRLFVAAYAPEVYVYSRRLFAGGHKMFLIGSHYTEADGRQIIERLERQVALFALLPSDVAPQWAEDFPGVQAYLEEHFRPLTDIPTTPDVTVRVLVHRGLAPTRVDGATGWPCYR